MNDISTAQIRHQIQGKTVIRVHYSDTDEPDFFSLTEQEGRFWLGLAFSFDRRITPGLAGDIRAMFTDEQEFNTDPEVIRTDLSRDTFLNRYYEPMLMNPATGSVAPMFEWLEDFDVTASELWGGVNFNDAMLVPVIQDGKEGFVHDHR
jgi:hypothetical protein